MPNESLNRRAFIHRMSGAVAAASFLPQSPLLAEESKERPNILYVFADQMRFCAMGCAGDPYVQTPNLDRLAAEGMMLTNAFSCTPLCSPYRAQLLTGRYGHATGVITNDIKLPESEITIAEVLRDQGYSTGYIGKWHLEGARRAPVGDIRHGGFIPPGPARQGFDFWAALECSHNYYKTHYYRDTPEPIPVDGYEPTNQANLAIDFMKANRERPFLLMLSFGPPHNPYKPPEEFDLYDPAKVPLRPNVPKSMEAAARRDIAQYYGLIASLDHEVGRMTQALDELGIAGRTIVCFSADHGDMLYSQGQRLKQRPWEEAAHIPFLLRWPDQIPAGQKKDALFASVDVMPTLLGLCGAPIPNGVQGVDLSQVLSGKSDKEPESVFLSINSTGGGGGFIPSWRAVRTKEWLYAWSVGIEDGDWLLYNVKDDPYELNNRVDDPACAEIKAKLRALTDQWRKETGDNIDLQAAMARFKGRTAPKHPLEEAEQGTAPEPKRPQREPEQPAASAPGGVTRLDFSFDKSLDGWTAAKDLAPPAIADGCLATKTTGREPSMTLEACAINGKAYPTVRVRMAASAGRSVTLWWLAEGLTRWSPPKSVPVPLQADGQFHDCVFAVGENPRWKKKIVALRLSVETDKPADIRIDFIRGEKREQ
ncbi:MAG: sulfatase [Candidatus Sumerlaeota bacterium]|nr:sulfatase [Candidatus Sumerlaeota bacterium]